MWHPDMPEEFKNAVVCGDAKTLAQRIPDASADLVFCDPVYEHIDDYAWLSQEAERVLKPDSACLVWFQTPLLEETLAALCSHLAYRWLFMNYRNGGPNPRTSWGFCKYAACLWMEKGRSRARKLTFDVVPTATISTYGSQHGWQKSVAPVLEWVQAFSDTGAVVWDPFTGSGTVPAVCKQLGRNWVAFEIDSETAQKARERVRLTPEPLLVCDSQPAPQMTLDVA